MTITLIATSALLILAGIVVLYMRRRRGRGAAQGEPWTRQDGFALASLISGALIGALGLVIPLATDNDPDGKSDEDGKLELVDTALLPETSKEPGPGLDMKLRNTSSEVSFLTELVLTIEYSGELAICEAGGNIETSFTYPVQMPLDPDAGQRVTTNISQEVKPNETDRFLARISLEQFTEAPQDISGQPVGYMVYVVNITLRHDRTETMKGGQAVLMVPVKKEFVQTEDYSAYLFPDSEDPCYDRNRAVFERLEDFDGAAKPATLLATEQ